MILEKILLKIVPKKAISIPFVFFALYPFLNVSAQENSFLSNISKLETKDNSPPQASQEKITTPVLNASDKEKKKQKKPGAAKTKTSNK